MVVRHVSPQVQRVQEVQTGYLLIDRGTAAAIPTRVPPSSASLSLQGPLDNLPDRPMGMGLADGVEPSLYLPFPPGLSGHLWHALLMPAG